MPARRLALGCSLLALPALLTACGPSGSPSSSAAGGPPPAAAPAPVAAAHWTLTAPQTAGGYPIGQPPAQTTQLVDSDLGQNAKLLGLSGTPVRATYDDQADGAWVFYSGLNGTGFDPNRLHDALTHPAISGDNGAGDHTSFSYADTDPGPHGGRAICDSLLVRNAFLTTMATTCSWFTPTTAARVTLVIKGDGTNTKIGFTAADVGPVMRAVRADVEQQ
ncbi:hypothetical protein [Kitasatospora viridis]|uniref:Lipoprotein n=1 Tax=Kitasatospora viridis TaxID=281105 RepID=A0A561S9H7_9ACTN|nr:hypothetical protein [Kitasatospora viridis]TWF71514.1 hypothetical protein FHX73_19144 [Kitasatospora viridis]